MKILVSDPVSEQGVAILQKEHEVDVKLKLSPEELIKIIPAYDALVVRSETKVTKAVIAAANKLKIIGRAGVGVDNIDVEAATPKRHHCAKCAGGQYYCRHRTHHGDDAGPCPQRPPGSSVA